MSQLKRTQVLIWDHQIHDIKALAKASGMSISEIVRVCIDRNKDEIVKATRNAERQKGFS